MEVVVDMVVVVEVEVVEREDIILEWIFLPNKQSKKLKTYVEKISDLILKGKLRLRQLAGIDPAEIVVPLTKEEIEKLWAEKLYGKHLYLEFVHFIQMQTNKERKRRSPGQGSRKRRRQPAMEKVTSMEQEFHGGDLLHGTLVALSCSSGTR
ncbi:hypothetical protein STEG23_006736 [Scotinomys teguina]